MHIASVTILKRLAELERRMSLLEGIARGERAVEEGRIVSHAQAKQRMARWLK